MLCTTPAYNEYSACCQFPDIKRNKKYSDLKNYNADHKQRQAVHPIGVQRRTSIWRLSYFDVKFYDFFYVFKRYMTSFFPKSLKRDANFTEWSEQLWHLQNAAF